MDPGLELSLVMADREGVCLYIRYQGGRKRMRARAAAAEVAGEGMRQEGRMWCGSSVRKAAA